MGALKGKIALKLFSKYPYLRKNKLWGNHFWQRGYFVDTVGINEEIIKAVCQAPRKGRGARAGAVNTPVNNAPF